MNKHTYKSHTMLFAVCQLMLDAHISGDEVEVVGIKNKHGEPAERSAISMAINKIRDKHFPDCEFYTITRRDGRLMLGVRKPQ